jgi:RHS repeat-associated protein
MKEMDVHSPLGSRRIFDLRYDPVGRELSRAEGNGEGVITGTNITYDPLGRLQDVAKVQGGTSQLEWTYLYDALGNVDILRHFPDSSPSAFLSSHQVGDRDRVCRIDYGPIGGPACNVVYDGVGNTIEQPTRTGARSLSYFASGKVRGITEGAAQANFRYDPFGNVQELDITGSGISDARHERRYGGLIERHDKVVGGTTTAFVSRNIPGPGVTISKRGTGNEWIFGFGELRGNRFFVDGSGAFAQTVDYQPYGEAKSNGVQPDSAQYTSWQWNGRDALGAFNLSHLGARLYDPVIGRFLSRDPLFIPRTAATTNAYAFVTNDPVNFSDHSGMQENFCFEFSCQGYAPPTEIPPGLYFPSYFNPAPAPAAANPHAANRDPAPTPSFNPPQEPPTQVETSEPPERPSSEAEDSAKNNRLGIDLTLPSAGSLKILNGVKGSWDAGQATLLWREGKQKSFENLFGGDLDLDIGKELGVLFAYQYQKDERRWGWHQSFGGTVDLLNLSRHQQGPKDHPKFEAALTLAGAYDFRVGSLALTEQFGVKYTVIRNSTFLSLFGENRLRAYAEVSTEEDFAFRAGAPRRYGGATVGLGFVFEQDWGGGALEHLHELLQGSIE